MPRFLLLISAVFCIAQAASAARDPGAIAAQRRKMGPPKAFGTVVPRSNEPSGELTVLRIWPDSVEMRIAVAALQGLANRDRPKLYIGIDKPLRWLEYHGGKTVTSIEPDVFKVFEKFNDYVKGIVVYDNSLDALANIAVTYAGIEDLIPADPQLAQTLSEKFGWKVVHDLRGKWKSRIEAYTWAFENLFPRCDKSALTHYNHGYRSKTPNPFGANSETGNTGFLVDYSVEFRSFCWHVPTEPTLEEKQLAERIFESAPFHTPIFGRSASQDCFPEPAFVSWVAQFGNLHIPAGMGNTSVLSGARVPEELLRQKELPVLRDMGPDKIYIAFTNSEKDNLEHVIGGGTPWHRLGMETDDPYKIWWSDPWRGRVPIGWPIGPLIADLAPTTLAQFMTTKTDNDYFLAALSGLCLSDPETYGTAYPEQQDELLAEYVKLTGDYMRRLGWTQAQPTGSPGILRAFTKGIPSLTGIMEGYGPHKGMTYEKANYLLDGVPVFHALTEGTPGTSRERPISELNPRKAKAVADEIKSIVVTGRPGFIHAWTGGWDMGPTTLKMTADLLPPEYVVVRPDELAALFKKYGGAALSTATPKTLTGAGRVTETASSDGLIVDTGAAKFEIGWGKTAQPPIKRIMGLDGKWRCSGRLDLYNPRSMMVREFSARKSNDAAAEKEYVLTYDYGNGAMMKFTIRALGGKPYLLVRQESRVMDVPSWGLDYYAQFQPDTLQTDAITRTLDYKGVKAMGGLPWSRWSLACKKEGPDRDLIGFFGISWDTWTNGNTTFWQHTTAAYLEFYQSRSGGRRFAVAALDKTDPDAPKRIWNEVNGR